MSNSSIDATRRICRQVACLGSAWWLNNDALSPVETLALLAGNVTHARHEFWTDSLEVPAAVKDIEARLQGYRQLTDAYLSALAQRRKGVLASFDRRLRTLGGPQFEAGLEIVPNG